jgi:dipeptidyl aminopeptidase/acylaminoacyl peptidase
MNRPVRLWGVLALLLSPLGAGTAAGDGPWTVDDLLRYQEAMGFSLAADGSYAVWVQSSVEKIEGEEQRAQVLLGSPLGDRLEPRRLTRARERLQSPKISPDGRHVAFVTDREPPGDGGGDDDRAKRQLWILPLQGGEAYPLTRLDRDVADFDWAAADRLIAAAEESPSAVERRREKGKDTAMVVEDSETPPVRLFAVDLEGAPELQGEVRRLTENSDWIDALAVSPDGRRAVVRAQQSLSYQFDSKVLPEAFLVDLTSGATTRLALSAPRPDGSGDRRLDPGNLRWARDGSGFYFTDGYSRHPLYRTATVTRLHFYDLAAGKAVEVPLDWERGLGGDYAVTADGFVALLADGVRYRPARYTRDGGGWARRDLGGTHTANLDDWVLGEDGVTLVYGTSAANRPPQWFAARLDGTRIAGERQLTQLNPGYEGKPTGRVEVLRWTGALGETVEGLLHYPLDYPSGDRPGERRPLVVDIHGGPTSADRDSWDQRWAGPNVLWRQRGAFVLQVNYHGSSDYGLDWVESIQGRYYELEIPDILAGVDHLVERGLVDPDRLATFGWSNGGILSAELITRTGRFKAAVIGAADVEWLSDWGNVDFGASFDNYYFGGPPWENVETYVAKSPFFRLTEVTTPTLIHTGTEDRNVPPSQSWSLFRALQQVGKAPVRFLLYPGEPHGLRKIAHQRRKLEEDLAWFDHHLFGKRDERNPAVQDGSPLALLLARAKATRVGVAFGVDHQGTLVPETVPLGGVQVGRFEVTRAQWAAFRQGFSVAPGEENLPVTGISFDEAQAYVRWLGETTGKKHRLATAEEAAGWAKKAGSGGNTLDHWAGYPPNPEDARRLREAASQAGPRSLLQPAGSHAGSGDPPIYDLDGNAAEWVVGADGKGVVAGPSADRPADSRSLGPPPSSEYVGLRVVAEG